MSAKIYCIECLETGEKYIGSTTEKYLSYRIRRHRYDKTCSSTQIIERGKYKYYLIEEVDESEKLIREQYWIDNTDCINKNRAYVSLNDKQNNQRRLNRYKYISSWGGDLRSNNNLLEIDLSLFSD